MKKAMTLCAAWVLAMTLLAAPASASMEDRAFSGDLKRFGAWVGEGIQSFGEQFIAFSQDPKEYLENSESLNALIEALESGAESLEAYWPTLASSVQGSVEAVFDSDLTWEEKADALKEYGLLAVPFLAEIDFEQMGDDAKAAMEALMDFLSTDNEEVVKEWLEENRVRLVEFGEYLTR